MLDSVRDEEIARLTASLVQHKEALDELAATLIDDLQSHATRHRALSAAVNEIVNENEVSAAIARKGLHGAELDDMASFDAEQRAWRAQDTVIWIDHELITARNSPDSKYLLNDLRCLDQIAQFERERANAALAMLKARVEYLEKWALTLSADSLSHAPDRRLRH